MEGFGDGVLSLASNGEVLKDSSWMMNADFDADKMLAGIYLPLPGKSNDHGELSLGGYDATRFTGDIAFFPVPQPPGNSYWGTFFQGITCSINGVNATFDNPNVAPITIVEVFFDFVSMSGACYQLVLDYFKPTLDAKTGFLLVDCGFLKNGPDVKLSFGGHLFTMVPQSYILHDTNSGFCTLLFRNSPGVFALGGPFLMNYYSIYDFSKTRFGFAKAVHSKSYPGHSPKS
ncbi:Vacuolar protease A [Blyttiomyces sp. JEL0837]|nr:Vacuolar protease A [Blyttiomyces sp. JEL0837]